MKKKVQKPGEPSTRRRPGEAVVEPPQIHHSESKSHLILRHGPSPLDAETGKYIEVVGNEYHCKFPGCSEKFKNTGNNSTRRTPIRRHIHSKHLLKEKPRCNLCGKEFAKGRDDNIPRHQVCVILEISGIFIQLTMSLLE